MGRLQYAESIATRKHKALNAALDASLPKHGLQRTGLAGDPYRCAGGPQFLGSRARLPRVNLIRRTQAGKLGATIPERGDHFAANVESGRGRSFNAAGLEQIFGEIRARAEVGNTAEISKKYPGPRPRAGKH